MLQAVDARNKSAHDEYGSGRVGLGRGFNYFPQSPGARSVRLATRYARGAVAPSGPLRGRSRSRRIPRWLPATRDPGPWCGARGGRGEAGCGDAVCRPSPDRQIRAGTGPEARLMAGRSSIERLPRPIQALAQEAIAEGATIDEIVRLIRTHGGTCSRSAVVRYVKRARERLRRWSEDKGLVDFWLKSQGERPEGGTGRLALETLRSLALRAAIALDREEEAPTADQIAPLALAMHRIEGAGKSGAERGERRRPHGRRAKETAEGRRGAVARGRRHHPRRGRRRLARMAAGDARRRRAPARYRLPSDAPLRFAMSHLGPPASDHLGPPWAALGRSGPE